ncbi:hypothetical protein GOODEAATRI_018084 [Goodea atripinnis]|uniref:ABC transmembrane type-1 domain-containing protein n=1 Tax=Goodea atripinnis TaxID=208336 RepID=A0ABV0PZJ5_9TELE
MQDSMAHATEAVNEVVFGIRVVRSFSTEKHEANRYNKRLLEIHTLKTRRDTVRAVYVLARRIAVVSQEPVLFSGSIRDNITYGLTDCSLEKIEEAARKANAHDFIKQLEKGYDTGKPV